MTRAECSLLEVQGRTCSTSIISSNIFWSFEGHMMATTVVYLYLVHCLRLQTLAASFAKSVIKGSILTAVGGFLRIGRETSNAPSVRSHFSSQSKMLVIPYCVWVVLYPVNGTRSFFSEETQWPLNFIRMVVGMAPRLKRANEGVGEPQYS